MRLGTLLAVIAVLTASAGTIVYSVYGMMAAWEQEQARYEAQCAALGDLCGEGWQR